MTGFTNWVKKHVPLVVAAAVVVVIGLVTLLWTQSVANEGKKQQYDIVQLQTRVETSISTCLDTGRIQAQVAQQEFAALKDVLVNVTAARYEGGDGALSQGGALISALQENYPQIDQSTWRKLSDVIVGCRQDIKDAQDQLQGNVNRFRNWTTGGVFLEPIIRNNFPNELLVTTDRTTGAKLTGKDALDYLSRVISVQDAKEAMKTGTLPDQDLFETTPPK